VKPVNFDYARPGSVEDALKLLDNPAAKIAAGAQSLGPMLNMRLVQPDLIIDITGIRELQVVEDKGDAISMGACVTHADIEDRRVPDVTCGAMASVASNIAYRAVRNRGTIGGSLTHADPSADWVSMMAVLGASVTLRGPGGSRTLPVEDYMLSSLEADIRPGEMLVSVSVPKLRGSARWGYYKSCRKTGEFAHAIGAFVIDRERGISRAVIGATESKPLLVTDASALIGEGKLDRERADGLLEARGMSDAIDRRVHVAALARAVEMGHAQ